MESTEREPEPGLEREPEHVPERGPEHGPERERVRVLRILLYEGERKWVEKTVSASIHGRRECGGGNTITAVTVNEFPEVLEKAQRAPQMEMAEMAVQERDDWLVVLKKQLAEAGIEPLA
jgi:hypothetical protein